MSGLTDKQMKDSVMQRTLTRDEARVWSRRNLYPADSLHTAGAWSHRLPRHCQDQYTIQGEDPADWHAAVMLEDRAPHGWLSHNAGLRYILWGYWPKTRWSFVRRMLVMFV